MMQQQISSVFEDETNAILTQRTQPQPQTCLLASQQNIVTGAPKSPTRSSFYTKSSITAASPPKSPIKSPSKFLSPTRQSKKNLFSSSSSTTTTEEKKKKKSDFIIISNNDEENQNDDSEDFSVKQITSSVQQLALEAEKENVVDLVKDKRSIISSSESNKIAPFTKQQQRASPNRAQGRISATSTSSQQQQQKNLLIPQFFFPNKKWVPEVKSLKIIERFTQKFNEVLYNSETPPGTLNKEKFSNLVREYIGIPSYFGPLIMKRAIEMSSFSEGKITTTNSNNNSEASSSTTINETIKLDSENVSVIKREDFLRFWKTTLSKFNDPVEMVYNILKDPNQKGDFISQNDFRSVVRALLDTHPGLEFLKHTLEFQDRYLETVIYRIFYTVNKEWNGRMTLRELKKSDLLSAFKQCEVEEDINKVLRFFSYEHFYVIYCKFWELDTDHDFLIDRDDLLRYGNHALTYKIIDRVLSECVKPFTSGVPGKMGYEDFVWFVLSEENKSLDLALKYWFKCVDIDNDGFLSSSDLAYFYEEQLQRMECLAQEPVYFEDIVCQLTDMIKPEIEGFVTLQDLINSLPMSGNTFNVLFNLNKFILFETRDPFTIRQEREEKHLTEWDRFARVEYMRLSQEDDDDDDMSEDGGSDSGLQSSVSSVTNSY
jgi:Ca2+-binding EF-hand superfamily protein